MVDGQTCADGGKDRKHGAQAVAAPNQHRLADWKFEISNLRFEIGNPESAHPARLPKFRRSIALPLRPTQGCHKVAARAWLPMPPEASPTSNCATREQPFSHRADQHKRFTFVLVTKHVLEQPFQLPGVVAEAVAMFGQ